MGIDVAGWRGCPLQRPIDPGTFLALSRLAPQLQALRELDPEQPVQYAADAAPMPADRLAAMVAFFVSGVPECDDCPLADGNPVGCHRRIEYPLDAVFEEQAFRWFQTGMVEEGTAARSLAVAILEQGIDGASWEAERGTLLERPSGLELRVGQDGEIVITSAAVVEALWGAVDIETLRGFLAEVVDACDALLDAPGPRTDVRDDGVVEVDVTWDGHPDHLADAFDDTLHERLTESRTLEEVRDVSDLLAALAERPDWQVLVHG